MLEPGVLLHVYGVEGFPAPEALQSLEGLDGVIDDEGWSYLVFTRPAEAALARAGLVPVYQASLPYEQWLDGDLSKPISVSGVVIVPPWCEPQRGVSRGLHIEPGLAFGTGAHPTTQRCLSLMARLLQTSDPPRTVLDLGCGTGVLSLAAIRLGATRARGCDLSRHAIEVARRNIAANELQGQVTLLHQAASELIESADLVLANLPPAALDEILAHPAMAASRWTIVSGMLTTQAERLVRDIPAPLEVVEVVADGHWRTILIRGPRVTAFLGNRTN